MMTKINPLGRRAGYWLPVVFWAGVIFSLSALELTPTSEIYWQDFVVKKTAHIVEYGVLFVLTFRAFLNTTIQDRRRAAFLGLAFVLLYAISDEYHQSFTPGREARVRDVIIDFVGGVLGLILLWKLLPKMPARLQNLAKSLEIA